MARRMVTASRQCSLPRIDCCADMARRKEHSTPPPASLLTGFSTVGFLAFPKSKWASKTAEDERKRKAACLVLLRDQRKEKFLDRIVTRDEKWVYYNNTSREGGWSAPRESAGSVAR
ncbi:hypothetical protein AVEN_253829-1 [Araneus ventricosus]|uniref:Uncharacterized protein n=1 Tax=Araneus ventricosus TaxID=182803 RepID=A0A4Y2TWE5_ARAVE|nr:hypothetical protein AVEN_253829-1 [Araneus ventricosus]